MLLERGKPTTESVAHRPRVERGQVSSVCNPPVECFDVAVLQGVEPLPCEAWSARADGAGG